MAHFPIRLSHFADELTAKSVDNSSNRGVLALADEIEVQHALDGSRLQAAADGQL